MRGSRQNKKAKGKEGAMHRFSLSMFLALMVATGCGGAIAKPVDCTAAEAAVIHKASGEAQKALTQAADAIHKEDSAAVDRLIRWLGVANAEQGKAVAVRLRSVATWLPKAMYRCENETTIKLGDVYAYVDPKVGLTITMGAFFFGAPVAGALSTKLGVLIHEASHFSIAGATKDPRVYGPQEALKLAKSLPAEAQRNAENIEYFVESLYFGLLPWLQTDTDQRKSRVAEGKPLRNATQTSGEFRASVVSDEPAEPVLGPAVSVATPQR